jgi:hypothetical protein
MDITLAFFTNRGDQYAGQLSQVRSAGKQIDSWVYWFIWTQTRHLLVKRTFSHVMMEDLAIRANEHLLGALPTFQVLFRPELFTLCNPRYAFHSWREIDICGYSSGG